MPSKSLGAGHLVDSYTSFTGFSSRRLKAPRTSLSMLKSSLEGYVQPLGCISYIMVKLNFIRNIGLLTESVLTKHNLIVVK